MNKKQRSANFFDAEVELLCDLVAKYIQIIENKNSHAGIWKEKEEQWYKIEKEFNARALGVHRSAKSLKLKYEGIKQKLKRKSGRTNSESCSSASEPVASSPLTPKKENHEGVTQSVDELNSDFDSDILPVSSHESKMGEIVDGRLEVIELQKKIARYELLMKEGEERQATMRWQHEARQRERDEKIKEIDLEIKIIQLERLKAEKINK